MKKQAPSQTLLVKVENGTQINCHAVDEESGSSGCRGRTCFSELRFLKAQM